MLFAFCSRGKSFLSLLVILCGVLLTINPLNSFGEPFEGNPAAIKELVESFETLKADPKSLSAIQVWMDDLERELASEQESHIQSLKALETELAETLETRDDLATRLDALNVALILLDDRVADDQVPQLAKTYPEADTEEGSSVGILADVNGTEIPLITREVDFEKDIYPIFQQRCFECHGPNKQRGQFRLDARQVVFDGGRSGTGIESGKGEQSQLFRRVAGLDEEEQMPPVGEKLTGEQMALIRAWIDQGAKWPEGVGSNVTTVAKHWSYEPPIRPSIPEVDRSDWPKNPIDSFVLSRLEEEHLTPQPEADPGVLLRRASLDLIGLPPSPIELKTFLSDTSPDAYDKAVDLLLASPHYGERWARIWLDLARYADTNGYEKDLRREMWPWRDWVIKAFNHNKPFDQFTIEQIAGDLLPSPDNNQLTATGFHRNTMLNDEGGIDPEEFRIVAVKDRVDTTGAVWLGTTIGCAQCHEHKFDPFTQEEYYQLLGFFNSTEDVGKGQEPVLELPTPEQEEERDRLKGEIETLQSTLTIQTPELDRAFELWDSEAMNELNKWHSLEPIKYSSTEGSILTQLEDHSLLAVGKNPSDDRYVIETTLPISHPTGLRLEVLTHETLPEGGPGRNENGGFVIDRLHVEKLLDNGEPDPIAFSDGYADHNEETFDAKSIVGIVEGRGWATDSSQEGQRVDRIAIFQVSRPAELDAGTRVRFTLTHAYGRGHNLGRFRFSVTSHPNPLGQNKTLAEIQAILAVATGSRNSTQTEKLKAHFRQVTPLLSKVRSRLAAAQARIDSLEIPTTMVLRELEEPRKTHVLTRGNFMAPGEVVEPGVPSILHELPEDAPKNRLTFAKWLVDRKNPLTARVFVNRVWLTYFGGGLVKTSEDFGTQGDPPSHPRLLDWLAVEFMDNGWDLKHIHKLIVTSSVYRQNSKVTPEMLERDPYNRLFTRGPRFRMEAEMVRDNALAIAGLLNRKTGGPSVFPPQPEGTWANSFTIHDTKDTWTTAEGTDRYRRGVYTFLRRTSPYPTMLMFDAPYRDVCTIQRPRTNTPLQALATLNDPTFIEASGGLAKRILSEGGESFDDRIKYGFELCIAQPPNQEEINIQKTLCGQAMAKYRKHPELARQIWETSRIDLDGIDPIEFAAWTLVSNVLLNMDETITKG